MHPLERRRAEMDPASTPPPIATTASITFQAIVAAVSHHAHRRADGFATRTLGAAQVHSSAHEHRGAVYRARFGSFHRTICILHRRLHAWIRGWPRGQ